MNIYVCGDTDRTPSVPHPVDPHSSMGVTKYLSVRKWNFLPLNGTRAAPEKWGKKNYHFLFVVLFFLRRAQYTTGHIFETRWRKTQYFARWPNTTPLTDLSGPANLAYFLFMIWRECELSLPVQLLLETTPRYRQKWPPTKPIMRKLKFGQVSTMIQSIDTESHRFYVWVQLIEKEFPRLLHFLAWFGNKTQENCAFFDATNGFVATIRKNDIETIDNALDFNYSYIDWKAVVAQFAIRAIRCFYKGSKVALTNAIRNFSYRLINPD